jgi:hypothetical protein
MPSAPHFAGGYWRIIFFDYGKALKALDKLKNKCWYKGPQLDNGKQANSGEPGAGVVQVGTGMHTGPPWYLPSLLGSSILMFLSLE